VEVVIVGKAAARLLPGDIGGVYSGAVNIEAEAFETQTGHIIATRTLERGTTRERPAVTAFDEVGAIQGALRRAGRELFLGDPRAGEKNAFLGDIMAEWLRRPTVVTMELAKVSFDQQNAVLDALRALPYVQEVVSRRYTNELLSVDVRSSESVDALRRRLNGVKAGQGRVVTITGYDGNKVIAELR